MLLFSLQPFNGKEDEGIEQGPFAREAAEVQNRGRADATQIIPCLGDAFGTEDDSANDGQQKGEAHLQSLFHRRQKTAFGHNVRVFTIQA